MPLRIYVPLVVCVGLIGFVTRGESSDEERAAQSGAASESDTGSQDDAASTAGASDAAAATPTGAEQTAATSANDARQRPQTTRDKRRAMKQPDPRKGRTPDASPQEKSRDELPLTKGGWKRLLSPEAYAVTRCSATEPAFTGKYWNCKKDGIYRCVCCGAALFDSDTKFDSGSGWPSFWEPTSDKRVKTKLDTSHGMRRIEVLCAKCGAHLGHVFPDGPQPTGQRYCINSAALNLDETREAEPSEATGDEDVAKKNEMRPSE
jgi:peptide-methionine (R)-S-oxide reductase